MEISKKSSWYRLALYGVFFNRSKIKNNLCPFMRRALFGLFLTLVIYAPIGAIFTAALLSPPIQLITALYYGDWAYFLVDYGPAVLGYSLWVIIIGILIIAGIAHIFDGSGPWMKARWQGTKDAVGGAFTTGAHKIGADPLVEWIKAVKAKICPPVTYVDQEPGH